MPNEISYLILIMLLQIMLGKFTPNPQVYLVVHMMSTIIKDYEDYEVYHYCFNQNSRAMLGGRISLSLYYTYIFISTFIVTFFVYHISVRR